MDDEGVGAVASDRLKNRIGGLGPDKRLGVVVVSLDEGGDVGLQCVDAAMDAALDLSVGEQRDQRSTWFSHDALVGVKCRW
jgi:hypothetical protein